MPIGCSLFVFMSLAYITITADAVPRQYEIYKDFINGLKLNEYTVFNQSSKNILYRIESHFTLLNNLELVAYPEKQIVANISGSLYSATFKILNTRSGQWSVGKCQSKFTLTNDFKYIIEWNGRQITVVKRLRMPQVYFRDVTAGDKLFARFYESARSNMYIHRLEVYSNDIPDSIYLLAFAWRENQRSQNSRKG